MILVDTNVLVALADEADGLNAQAVDDFSSLAGRRMFVPGAVIAETCFFLKGDFLRTRLERLVHDLDAQPVSTDSRSFWELVFAWLKKYEDQSPDWADACLAVLSGMNKRFRVWTYDEEFRTVWRRPDGTKIPLAVK